MVNTLLYSRLLTSLLRTLSLKNSRPSSNKSREPFSAISKTRFPTTGSFTQKNPSSRIDFLASFTENVVNAIKRVAVCKLSFLGLVKG
jgi:hypothetical protein